MGEITESEMYAELEKLWGLKSESSQQMKVLGAIRVINGEGKVAEVSEICHKTGMTRRAVTSVACDLISQGDIVRPPGVRGKYVATRREG